MAVAMTTAAKNGMSDVTLGRLLQDRGVINEHQLVDALRAQAAGGGRLGTILVRRGVLSDAQLEAALRTQDEMRRAGVALDLAVVAAGGTSPRSMAMVLTVVVPPAGTQGGLPHHGVSARQQFLVPVGWLPAPVVANDLAGEGGYELKAEDGRMVDYGIEISIRASDDPLPLVPGESCPCPRGEPREGGFEEITVMVTLAADSLRDGGAGRFTGRFGLQFG